jgi:hypothetical protein
LIIAKLGIARTHQDGGQVGIGKHESNSLLQSGLEGEVG